ncbi:uncharacterized protein LOC122649300 [Telopea speciosissima]|uniref:uncharacterized protein LOC122649300 n=1 Tax=Telopea speciosissima TaxID=54955 RepID=UPI001CC5134C|nr:uncharacterized protein LOC122649300 [Telopea speciosissima]
MAGESSKALSLLHYPHSPQQSEPPDDEEDFFNLDAEVDDLLDAQTDLVLIGKVLDGKAYHQQAVTEAHVAAWHPIWEIQIPNLDDNGQLSHSFSHASSLEMIPHHPIPDTHIIEPTFQESSSQIIVIDAKVSSKLHPPFFLTCIYGDPIKANRQQVWDTISAFGAHRHDNWTCIGDFNSYLSWHEKKGGRLSSAKDMDQFRSFLNSCRLMDIGSHGPSFTWDNKRKRIGNIKVELDRALTNGNWRTTFAEAIAYVCTLTGSDHLPLIADTEGGFSSEKRPFLFENKWFTHPECFTIAQKAWSIPRCRSHCSTLLLKSHNCKEVFSNWNKDCFGNVQQKIRNYLTKMETLKDKGGPNVLSRLGELEKLLDMELQREELLWQQKSRVQWLKEGDRNTKYFHISTIQRRSRSRVLKLRLGSGEWARSEKEIFAEFLSRYQDIFFAQGLEEEALEVVLHSIFPTVTPHMNDILCKIPDAEEIKSTLKDMAPLKYLGLDGLPAAFFKCTGTWNGVLSSEMNETYICLVPKVDQPEKVDQFRPISLCNVSVKIISKIFANRLKGCLDDIISPYQFAFVPRRSISDNILMAHEAYHYIKKRTKGKRKLMAIKLDMAKAYDRLEWKFIEKVFLRLGFSEKWVHMIMACITLVNYKLLINGSIRGGVIPSRGIRQGDPLSPAIFVLCSHALSSLLMVATSHGPIQGIKVRNRITPLTHLLFVDDSLVFYGVSLQEVQNIKACLDIYCDASGQQINCGKSSLTFSPNTHPRFKRWFSRILKMTYGDGPRKYLGLPIEIGVSKHEIFKEIKEKTINRMQGWKQKFLSKAGKEVLIKSVAMSMNSYAASHFKLPQIYFPNTDFLSANLGSNPSWGWRSIIEGRKIILDGLTWFVGDGKSIKILEDKWLTSKSDYKIQHGLRNSWALVWVFELIDEDARSWKSELISTAFHPEDAKAILQIKLSIFSKPDQRVWSGSPNGVYTVKAGYHFLCNKRNQREREATASSSSSLDLSIPDATWKKIWNCHTLTKVRSFLWRACSTSIATGEGLLKQNIKIDPTCPRCGALETVDHLLLDCPFARSEWFGSMLSFIPPPSPKLHLFIQQWNGLRSYDKKTRKEALGLAAFICWALRKARNESLFNGVRQGPLEVIKIVEVWFNEFNEALNSTKASSTVETNKLLSWLPPKQNWFKLNTDASSKGDLKGLGYVIHNDQGIPITAVSAPSVFTSVLMGEALSLRLGLLLAIAEGIFNLEVESDCLQLISILNDLLAMVGLFFCVRSIGLSVMAEASLDLDALCEEDYDHSSSID